MERAVEIRAKTAVGTGPSGKGTTSKIIEWFYLRWLHRVSISCTPIYIVKAPLYGLWGFLIFVLLRKIVIYLVG